jgi:hypothetical protein
MERALEGSVTISDLRFVWLCGYTLKEASVILDVSKSKIRQICRSYGIKCWRTFSTQVTRIEEKESEIKRKLALWESNGKNEPLKQLAKSSNVSVSTVRRQYRSMQRDKVTIESLLELPTCILDDDPLLSEKSEFTMDLE